MDALRTPDDRFADLPDWPYVPHYTEVPDGHGGTLRMAHVDEGPRDANPILMIHGEPSWGYLYRHMIPILVAAGQRVVVPDLIGFGRSDKPTDPEAYTYQSHMDWLEAWITETDLWDMTLVCQDWGGLLGLRMAAEDPERFDRIVAANTFLPTGDHPLGEAFDKWLAFSQTVDPFPVGQIVQGATTTELSDAIVAAYDAPFPDESYKVGARRFPAIVPGSPNDPAAEANRAAWAVLSEWKKPFLCAFSDADPVTAGLDAHFRKRIPGAADQAHTTIEGGGHFLQEDRGEELARVVLAFLGG